MHANGIWCSPKAGKQPTLFLFDESRMSRETYEKNSYGFIVCPWTMGNKLNSKWVNRSWVTRYKRRQLVIFLRAKWTTRGRDRLNRKSKATCTRLLRIRPCESSWNDTLLKFLADCSVVRFRRWYTYVFMCTLANVELSDSSMFRNSELCLFLKLCSCELDFGLIYESLRRAVLIKFINWKIEKRDDRNIFLSSTWNPCIIYAMFMAKILYIFVHLNFS